MKRLLLLIIFIAAGLSSFAKEDWNYKNYFRSDSAHVFLWDATANEWILSSSQVYTYDPNGKLRYVIDRSFITGSYISRAENLYNEKGLLAGQNFFIWNGVWIPSGRNKITYDENDKTSDIIIQSYNSGNWLNYRWQKNYKYDLEERLTEFQIFDWRNNTWSAPTTDYSTYDDLGRLIRRVAFYSTGKTSYQVIYNYDANGLMSERHAQYPSGTGWFNWWLINYQYNDCGAQLTQVQFKGIITDWIPQTKTVSYTSFNADAFPGNKIPVCHNGNTIYISKNALKAHLAHGDCIGECTVEKNSEAKSNNEKEKPQNPPFTIYPNPATERITVKFDKNEGEDSKRVELVDFYGKLIKSFNIKDNSDLTINRQNLPSGKYYLRLVGKDVFSAVVIFE